VRRWARCDCARNLAPGDQILFPAGFVVAAVSGYRHIIDVMRFQRRKSIDVFV
jgi:hypothetical protein